MSDTRDKLLESKYFLERMTETQSNRDAFKYNLSAFLAATRSVTAIMQKVSGFKGWYEEIQAKLQSDDTMKLLKNKRNITIHQQPVRPRAHVNVSITEHIVLSDSVSIVITRADGTVERRESEPTPSPGYDRPSNLYSVDCFAPSAFGTKTVVKKLNLMWLDKHSSE
ncbi:unnamed protein product [marine sediment metagenome]|uniref:Uncharacterized protein n=1 Tax=marine sediment metagenome TaxID=412755 RepID=X1QBU9_9ZZZZ